MNIRDCLIRGVQPSSTTIISEIEGAIREKTLRVESTIAEVIYKKKPISLALIIAMPNNFLARIAVAVQASCIKTQYDNDGRVVSYAIDVIELESVTYKLNRKDFTENGVGVNSRTPNMEGLRDYIKERLQDMTCYLRYDEDREVVSISTSL